jgi:hypothetical protein
LKKRSKTIPQANPPICAQKAIPPEIADEPEMVPLKSWIMNQKARKK